MECTNVSMVEAIEELKASYTGKDVGSVSVTPLSEELSKAFFNIGNEYQKKIESFIPGELESMEGQVAIDDKKKSTESQKIKEPTTPLSSQNQEAIDENKPVEADKQDIAIGQMIKYGKDFYLVRNISDKNYVTTLMRTGENKLINKNSEVKGYDSLEQIKHNNMIFFKDKKGQLYSVNGPMEAGSEAEGIIRDAFGGKKETKPLNTEMDPNIGEASIVTIGKGKAQYEVVKKNEDGTFNVKILTGPKKGTEYTKDGKALNLVKQEPVTDKETKKEPVDLQRESELGSIEENQELYEKMKAKLLKTYPEIKVNKIDAVYDEYGAEVLGKAIKDMVYYSENSSIDTLPHEYAHIYVNLLEDTTYVKNTINLIRKETGVSHNEAKEILVTKMGQYYVELATGNKIGSKYGKLTDKDRNIIKKMWDNMVKIFNTLFDNKTVLKIANEKRAQVLARKFYEGVNASSIRLTPKPGTELIDPSKDLENQPFESGVLYDIMESANGKAIFTGSEALAMQGDVYRKQGENGTDLHDLDFAVKDQKTIDKVVNDLDKKYELYSYYDFFVPSNADFIETVEELAAKVPTLMILEPLARKSLKYMKSNHIRTLAVLPDGYVIKNVKKFNKTKGKIISYDVIDKDGKVAGTYTADVIFNKKSRRTEIVEEKTTGVKAVLVDLIEDNNQRNTVEWTAPNGDVITISNYEDIFKAKNKLSSFDPRDKDVADINLFKEENKIEKKTLDDKNKTLLVKTNKPENSGSVVVKKELDNGFTAKKEYHITALGFPQGKELKKIFKEKPEMEAKVQKLIDEADFSYTEGKDVYKIERDTEPWVDWKDHSKGKKKQHDEALIVKAEAPGVEKFIGEINELLGTDFPVPYPHISIATKGSPMGIGIPNEAGFKKLKPEKLTEVGSKQTETGVKLSKITQDLIAKAKEGC